MGVSAVVVVALAFLVVPWTRLTDGMPDRADVLGAVVGIAAFVVGLLQLRRSVPATAPDRVQRLADNLARATLARWELEARNRWGKAPAEVSVRWRRADAEVAVDLDVTVPWAGKQEDLRQRIYGPVGRLVILGEAGTGKTMSMMLLLIDILKHRQLGGAEPVPVWLTLSGWDPERTPLRSWVVSEMSRATVDPDVRGLGRRGAERQRDAARALLDGGQVALFMDGLDEMPTGRAGDCLRAIHEATSDLRVVLTSRREEFAKAIDEHELWHAAVIALEPVDVDAAGEFLLAQQRGAKREAWREVADHLAAHPGSVAARALNTPLTLSLARDAYRDADPRALIDPDAFGTPKDLTRRLLVQSLMAAYPGRRERMTALRWLEWIAHRMDGRRDLQWWDIPPWLAASRRSLARRTTVLAAGVGVACGLLTFGSALGDAFVPAAFMIVFYAVVGAVTVGAVLDVGCQPRRIIPWLGVEGLRSLAKVAGVLTAIVLGYAVLSGSVGWSVLTGGLVLCLPFLPGFGIAPLPSLTGALESYRADRRRVVMTAAYGALLLAILALGIVRRFDAEAPASTYVLGALIGAVNGAFLYAMFFGLGSVPALWHLQLVLLAEGAPVSFLRLLHTAHKRRILRQAGTVYQFRHATLQDLFTEHPELIREKAAG